MHTFVGAELIVLCEVTSSNVIKKNIKEHRYTYIHLSRGTYRYVYMYHVYMYVLFRVNYIIMHFTFIILFSEATKSSFQFEKFISISSKMGQNNKDIPFMTNILNFRKKKTIKTKHRNFF